MNRKFRSELWMSSGFTLVELLVVVSIIALLIAILMPSLKKARESAKRVACNSCIRGIANAGLTYAADDPQEFGVPVNPEVDRASHPFQVYFAYGGKGGRGGTGARSDSWWGAGEGMGTADRPLNRIFYKTEFKKLSRWAGATEVEADQELELSAYKCVGDRSFPGMHYAGWKNEKNAKTGYDYFGTSYACNPMWVHDPNSSSSDRAFSNSMYYRPMSRVPNPGNTIMFWEAAARFAIYADNTEEYGSPGSGQSDRDCRQYFDNEYVAKGFHGEPWHFNIAFGDGHAAWSKVKSFPVATGNKLPASCGDSGRLCQCVIVRGRGWQMDTFPAPLIKTPHESTGGSMIEVASGGNTNADNVVVP